MNEWMKFLDGWKKRHPGVSLKEAMKRASVEYRKMKGRKSPTKRKTSPTKRKTSPTMRRSRRKTSPTKRKTSYMMKNSDYMMDEGGMNKNRSMNGWK